MKKAVQIICTIAVLMVAVILCPKLSSDYPPMEVSVVPEDIEIVSGYTVEGNTFLQTNEDPNFTISHEMYKPEAATLVFSDNLSESLTMQIYYAASGKDFEEKKSLITVLEAGESQYQIGLPSGNYTKLRFDIDGNFSLEKIDIAAHSRQWNYVKLVVYLVISVLVLVLVWKYVLKLPGYYEKLSEKLYAFGRKHGVRQEKFFFVAALCFGIAFSFLLPPEQVPDEWNHISMIESEFGAFGYISEMEDFYDDIETVKIPGDLNARVDRELLKEHAGDRFSKEGKSFGVPSISCIKHLPAGIGFFLGVLFHAPILVCLQLAELFSVIFYAVVGYFTLKILPIKKELFCGVMLLPMTLQQCSSINYDAVLLPISFFMLAYLLNCIYVKQIVGWKEITIIALLLLYITLLKPPYALMAAVVFLIPKDKWNLKLGQKFDVVSFIRKYIVLFILTGILFVGLAGYVFRNSQFVKVIVACLLDFPQYIRVLYGTLRENGVFYVQSAIGIFGCLDTYVNLGFYILGIVALALFSQSEIVVGDKKAVVGKKDRIVYAGVSVAIIVLVITIMFTWSFFLRDYDSTAGISRYVEYLNTLTMGDGVQGRYYIPVIPLCFLCIHGIVRIRKKDLIALQLIYYPMIIFMSIQELMHRFWL